MREEPLAYACTLSGIEEILSGSVLTIQFFMSSASVYQPVYYKF